MSGIEKPTGDVDLAMTELDQRLRGPGGEVAAVAVLERFSSLNNRLEETKTAGLSPEDFAATETLLKAVAAAVQTVIAFRKFHQMSTDESGDGIASSILH